MSDEYDEPEFEEEDFQESPDVNALSRYEEVVFCPHCDVYMPYKVDGAIVRRKCPNCGKEFEGGQEVAPGRAESKATAGRGEPRGVSARAATRVGTGGAAAPVLTTERETCQALTKAGTACNNPPRAGSKYCSSHRGYRPPRK